MSPIILISLITFASLTVLVWSLLNTGVKSWINYESVFTETTESRLQQLFLFADSRKILFLYVGLLLVIPIILYLIGSALPYVLTSLLLIAVMPKIIFSKLEKKRRNAINQSLPDALAQMAGAMKAGSTLTTAIEAMVTESKGPIGQEFSLVLREQRLGTKLEDALDNLGERVQSEEMDLVISASLIARDVGGNLAEIFSRLSETIRKKLEMEGKIKALTAQGILQGWVVSLLPFGILFALTFIEAEAIEPIYKSILGWGFMFVIIVLEVIGGLMIKKIVTIDI